MKKRKRLASWLLVLVLVLNIFSPLNTVWAEGLDSLGESLDSVIEISGSDDVATGSQATMTDDSSAEEESGKTDVSNSAGDPVTATDSNARSASKVSLLSGAEETGKEVSGLLENLTIAINGLETGEITAGSDFTVSGSFDVPVVGDGIMDSSKYVSLNDFATLLLSEHITVSPASLDLTYNGESVGTLTFTDGKAYILFDGEAMEDLTIGDVHCTFSVAMKYTGDDLSEETPSKEIMILDKTFTVKAPEIPITQSQEKSGKLSEDKTQIIWTVTVNVTKGTSDYSLDGYKFQDDLSGVGDYVDDSFKIGEETVSSVTYENKILTYTFGETDIGEKTITFNTKIPADTLIAGGTIKNTAQFGKDTLESTTPFPVTISKKTLIDKTGTSNDGVSEGIYNPNNRTITWTIIANQDQLPLKDLAITDILPATPSGLTWHSASWEYSSGTDENGKDIWTALSTDVDELSNVPIYIDDTGKPNNEIYQLTGTTSKKVRLTIVCKVTDDAYVGSVKTYTNNASLTWDGQPEGTTFKDSASVGIGIDSIQKSYVSTDYAKRQITWKVNVNLYKQSGFSVAENIKVYDLRIYGNSANLSGSNLPTLVGAQYESLKNTNMYGQKVVDESDGSNTWTSNGLTYTIEPVTIDGARIGDLLVVTGFDNTKAYTFNFKSQVLDPNVFAANTGKSVSNTAFLYYGEAYLDNGTASTTYTSSILSKNVLAAETSNIGDNTNGFNYSDKTAVFRLNINTEGYDLTGADTDTDDGKLGKVTVTDSLPAGWSFISLDSGEPYELYKISGSNSTLVTDVTDILDTSSISISGQTAKFTFTKLDAAYYILVKAQLSDEQYMSYLDSAYSGTTPKEFYTATNTVTMTADDNTGWAPSKKEATVNVPTKYLVKNVDTGKDPIVWTILFNPYELSGFENITLTDTIPDGLELMFKKDGSLDFTAFEITEFDPTTDGSFPASESTEGTVLDTQRLSESLSYDKITRTLTFVPTNGKLYQIVYKTEVTGTVGATLKNQVTVSGNALNNAGTNASYKVDESHASATFTRNGYLNINKVDAGGTQLSDAVFTLYADKALTTPVRTSYALSDGTLRIIPIPAPKEYGDEALVYYLKETTIPAEYLSDDMVYTVTVTKDSSGKAVTTVSGKDPGETLTVVNYKENTVGSLSISKTVDGNAGDPDQEFNFTIEFTGGDIDNTYNYIGSGSKENGQIVISGNRGTFQLKHNESITITGLPKDIHYQISEEDSGDGYLSSGTGKSGDIVAGTTQTASFTNTKLLPGSLAIKKIVDGNANEDIAFDFTVTFKKSDGTVVDGSYNYSGTGGSGTISSGGHISLAHDQSIIITGLPADTVYTVTENDYTGSGYTSSLDQAAGVIETDKGQIVSFTNTKWLPGSLTIKKTVAGNAEENIKFDFTVTLTKPDGTTDSGSYEYSGTGGSGTVSSGGHISLAHGQSITITGLPKDTAYKVTENNYSENGYTMSSDHASGTIVTNDEQTASFTNTKWQPGSLTISKTVTGSGADTKKKFDFTVTFTADGSYSYTGNGVDGGTIKSGDNISLADGESITITGLPDGTKYQVTEADYTSQRYTATSTGDTGTINTLITSAAAFTNTYHKRSSGGGGGSNSGPTPTPTAPTEPATSSPKPREEMTPQEVYDVYGEMPQGYMAGPDNNIYTPQEIYDIWGQVPLGYMVGIDGQLVPLGLPKTGDGRPANMAVHVLFGFSILLGIFASATILRKDEETDK